MKNNMEKIEGYCRLCATECENKGTSLKQKTSNGDSILDIINDYFHLKIPVSEETDYLPRDICPACSLNIEILVQFLDLVKDGQLRFKELRELKRKSNEASLITYKSNEDVEKDVNVDLISEDSDEMPELESINKNNETGAPQQRKFHGTIQTVDGFAFGKIEIQTSKTSVFVCNICEASFKAEPDLGRHNSKHRNTIFECCVCSLRFASRDELQRHHSLMGHFGEIMVEAGKALKDTTMGCKFCNIDFITVEELVRHSQLAHSNQYSYACSKCTRSFDSLSLFICHARQHEVAEETICIDCGGRFRSKASYDEHRSGNACRGVYRCPKCSKTFLRKHSLVAHMRLHDESSPFVCNTCRRRFSYKKELDVHMKTHSEGDHEFICRLCNEKFNTEYLLKRHRREKHSSTAAVKKMSCSICGKDDFKNLHELAQHIRTHDQGDEKVFTCPVCSKQFTGNCRFKQHLQSHGAKVYLCTSCGKRFTNEEYLRVHMKRHEKLAQKSIPASNKTNSDPATPQSSTAAVTQDAGSMTEQSAFSEHNPPSTASVRSDTSNEPGGFTQQRTISMSTDDGSIGVDPMEPIDFDQLVQEKMVEVYSEDDLDELDDDMLFVITGNNGKNYKKAEVEELGSSIKGGKVESYNSYTNSGNIVVDDNLPID